MKFCRYTPCFSYNFSSTSHVFINIHEYENKIIFISNYVVKELYLSLYLVPSLVPQGILQLEYKKTCRYTSLILQ